MNSYTWINLVFVILSIWNFNVHAQLHIFDVSDFGAVADGETDSTEAFANTWNKACKTPGGVVFVPAGKSFIISDGDFSGPCNGLTVFRVDGTLVASDDPKFDCLKAWITFENLDNLKVVGNGTFDGNGPSTWSRCGFSSKFPSRPISLRFDLVRDVEIEGIRSKSSPNIDGIHIGSSRHMRITDSSEDFGLGL